MSPHMAEGSAHRQPMPLATVLARQGPRELCRSASQPGISSKHVSLDKTLAQGPEKLGTLPVLGVWRLGLLLPYTLGITKEKGLGDSAFPGLGPAPGSSVLAPALYSPLDCWSPVWEL